MRSRLLLGSTLLAALAGGCVVYDDHDHWGDENEIVFGIRQRKVTTDEGEKTEVTAGYDYLRLAHKGGWAPAVFRDGDGEGTCYFESFDDRLGQPHVQSGSASFGSDRLGYPGIQILANQPDVTTYEGEGWADGDILAFDVTGFALPYVPPISLRAPRTSLDVTAVTPAPADSVGELSIKASDSVGVTWSPTSDEPHARVMVALEVEEEEGRGSQVRCFARTDSGSAVIPAQWVARLFSTIDPGAPIRGTLSIASHRQATYYGRGSWVVYVVATSVHHERAFNGVR